MAATSKKKKATRKKAAENTGVSQKEEVILWIVLACSILLFLSNLGIGGIVGNSVSSVFFGIFGLVSYVFPICLFLMVAFTISNKDNKIAWIKIFASILFLLFL